MNKRGISPLVATVLLIGFTIAIAVLVFLFLRGQVEELTAKFGAEEFTAEEEATTTFTIQKCLLEGAQDVTLKISNEGKMMIDCFWIVPKGQEAIYYTWNIKAGEQDERKLTIGTPENSEVEIYPCLIRDGKIKTGKISVKAQCTIQ